MAARLALFEFELQYAQFVQFQAMHRALIFAAVGLLPSLSLAAPLKVERTADVKAVYVTTGKGGPEGGTTRVQVRIAPNKSHSPSVGIMEEFSGGTGDQWRTALWQAAFVSTQATSTSLLDYEFVLRVGGRIDGPSAGLLTAATLTALIRGKKVLPNTTMTGTINPDGSAGPVGGVLYKLRGAAADGIKRFGFPLGARQQTDAAGESFDLLAEASKLGIEARELRSLDEAYAFLTGETLPRPKPAQEASLELSPDEFAALKRQDDRVLAELEAQRPEFELAVKKLQPQVAERYLHVTDSLAAQAKTAATAGELTEALFQRSAALTVSTVLTMDARLRVAREANDWDTLAALVSANEKSLDVEGDAFRKEIDAQFQSTSTLNDILAMDLFESLAGERGQILRAQAEGRKAIALAKDLKTSRADPNAVFRSLSEYAKRIAEVREEYKSGRRFLTTWSSLPQPKKRRAPFDARALSAAYAAAGDASRAYFEAIVTAPAAQAAGVSQAEIQGTLIDKSDAYLNLIGYGDALRTETVPRFRLLLALRQTLSAAYLVNTFYALGGSIDAKGELHIANGRALTTQLDLAVDRVLESCGRAERDAGMIPIIAKMRFLSARANREGSDGEKTVALFDLWLANRWCALAAGS